MLKKIYNSKYTSIALDAIGIFSLASFIFLGLYLRFIVDIIPSCYFTDALIVYVECGNGFWDGVLKFYFQFFSPFLIMWMVPLLGYGLVMSLLSFKILPFLTSLLLTTVLLISIITSIRIAYKILKRLTWWTGGYEQKDRALALMLSVLILIPSAVAMGLKYYLAPPQSSDRIITIDMWHNEFSIQRHYLHDWSLVDIERPAQEPSAFASIGRRGRNIHPFASIDISYNEIDPSFDEGKKVRIGIAPHYNLMTEQGLYKKREKYLEGKKARQSRGEALYAPVQRLPHWELYEPVKPLIYERNILIHRNAQGQIENILECTPKTHCAQRMGLSGTRLPKCKTPEECENCSRVCDESSFGTTTMNVRYTFDKKYLDSYFDRHKKIIEFVNTHTTPKTPEAFVYNANNIVSWQETDGTFSIELTEQGQQEFAKLTKKNLGMPISIYVGDLLVSSPIIREVIASGRMTFFTDDEMRQKVINALPSDKREINSD